MWRALASSAWACRTSSGFTAFAGSVAKLTRSERKAARKKGPWRSKRGVERVVGIALFGGSEALAHGLCPLRRADPQAPVRQRQAAADKHHHGAEPDQPHQGIEIDPDA